MSSKHKSLLKKTIQEITNDRFGPKDHLGWPVLIDDVISMTDKEACERSRLHFDLKKLVYEMESNPVMILINSKLDI